VTALAGKRIVVTRAEEQADGLCRALERAGAFVIRCPTIRMVPPESHEALDEALGRLREYRWLVFTSSNGVRAVLSRMAELGLSPKTLDGARVAAVGASTARVLEGNGVRAGFVPRLERSRALAESLVPVEGEDILLARTDAADPAVAETLRRRGARSVDDVVAYRTLLLLPSPGALEELRRGVDGITFTSPSTLRGFLRGGPEVRGVLDGVIVASLGPATTDVARGAGIAVDVEADQRSMKGLVDALDRAFASGTADDERESAE